MMLRLILLALLFGVPAEVRGAGPAGDSLTSTGGPAVMVAVQQPPPQQQDEFVPIDELPPQDQLPAAPLLVAAYAFVVLTLFAYIISVGRRLGRVQQEVARIETDLKRGGRT